MLVRFAGRVGGLFSWVMEVPLNPRRKRPICVLRLSLWFPNRQFLPALSKDFGRQYFYAAFFA